MDETHTATGKVELVTQSKVMTKNGEADKYNLSLVNDESTYSGWGECKWKEGEKSWRVKTKSGMCSRTFSNGPR